MRRAELWFHVPMLIMIISCAAVVWKPSLEVLFDIIFLPTLTIFVLLGNAKEPLRGEKASVLRRWGKGEAKGYELLGAVVGVIGLVLLVALLMGAPVWLLKYHLGLLSEENSIRLSMAIGAVALLVLYVQHLVKPRRFGEEG